MLASPQQLRRQGTPSSPADLSRLDTVAMSSTDGKSTWNLVGPDGEQVVVHSHMRYVADDLQTLKLAMLAGTDIGFLPENLRQAGVEAERLVPVLPDWRLQRETVHAVFPFRRGKVPAVRSFLDFMGEHMRGEQLVAVVARPASRRPTTPTAPVL